MTPLGELPVRRSACPPLPPGGGQVGQNSDIAKFLSSKLFFQEKLVHPIINPLRSFLSNMGFANKMVLSDLWLKIIIRKSIFFEIGQNSDVPPSPPGGGGDVRVLSENPAKPEIFFRETGSSDHNWFPRRPLTCLGLRTRWYSRICD